MRNIERSAGRGDLKKRMPICNGEDTSFNVTRQETEQTSGWSLIVREFVESLL